MPRSLPLMLQVLLGWTCVQFLELEPNPENSSFWKQSATAAAEGQGSPSHEGGKGRGGGKEAARKGGARTPAEQELQLTVWEQVP